MDTMDVFVSKWRERVADSSILSDKDKELFIRYAEDAQRNQIGDSRISKYLSDANTAHRIAGRGISQITASLSTLEATCGEINSSKKYGTFMKRDVKRFLASIYNFRNTGQRSLQDADARIKACGRHRIKATDRRVARPIISREEMRELAARANSIMDKALIWVLFESGMRNGEFQQMARGNISQIEEGVNIKVPPGKTGEREVVLVEAAKYLNEWLETHPSKKEDAPLWVDGRGKPLMRAAIARRLRMMKARLNEYRRKEGTPLFMKSVNPHNFRHSRASELGGEPGMTEQILCKVFGWEIGSPMPKTYLHLTPEQIRRAIIRTYGKAREEQPKQIETEWVCPRCKERTPLGQNFCGRCGNPKAGKVISKTAMLEGKIDALEKEQATTKELLKKLMRQRMQEKIK